MSADHLELAQSIDMPFQLLQRQSSGPAPFDPERIVQTPVVGAGLFLFVVQVDIGAPDVDVNYWLTLAPSGPPSRAHLVPVLVQSDGFVINSEALIPYVEYPFTFEDRQMQAVKEGEDGPVVVYELEPAAEK